MSAAASADAAAVVAASVVEAEAAAAASLPLLARGEASFNVSASWRAQLRSYQRSRLSSIS